MTYADIVESFEGASPGVHITTTNTAFPRVDDGANGGAMFATGGNTGQCAIAQVPGTPATQDSGGSFYDTVSTNNTSTIAADAWTARTKFKITDGTSTLDAGYLILSVDVGEVGKTPANWATGSTDSIEIRYDAGTKNLKYTADHTRTIYLGAVLGQWLDIIITGTSGAATVTLQTGAGSFIDSEAFTLTSSLYRARSQVENYRGPNNAFHWEVDDIYFGRTANDPFSATQRDALLCEDFEGGLSGDLVTTDNTSFYDVTGTSTMSSIGVNGSLAATGGAAGFDAFDTTDTIPFDEDVVVETRFKVADDFTAVAGNSVIVGTTTSKLDGTEVFSTGPELRYVTPGPPTGGGGTGGGTGGGGGTESNFDFAESFEGAADGVQATTSTTAFTGNNADTAMTHSILHARLGQKALRIINPATTAGLYNTYSPARTTIYRRVYWYSAANTTGTNIMALQTGGTVQSAINYNNANGKFRLRDGSTTTATSTMTVATGQWYRLEHFVDMATGSHTARIFTGANLEGTTPDETLTGSCTTGTFDRSVIGVNGANTLDWFWDAYAVSFSDWVGAIGTSSSTGSEFSEDFEGANNGTAATLATTGFTGGNLDAAMTHSTTHSISGVTSLRIHDPALTAGLYNTVSPARAINYQRVYWYAATLVSGTNIMMVQTGGTLKSNVNYNGSNGKFRLRDGATVTASSTMTATTGQWYRLEHFVNMTSGTHTMRIFTGANLHGTTPDETLTGSCATGTFDRIQIGTNGANTLDWYWDAYAYDTAGYIGPFVETSIEFVEGFEGAANGAQADTSTTLFTGAQPSAALTHSTLHSQLGTRSMRIHDPTGTTGLYRAFTPARTSIYRRVYWYAAEMTDGSTIMSVQTGSTMKSNIRVLAASSKFQLRDGSTITATSTTDATVGQWYRFEHYINMTLGQHKVRIFTGSNLNGTVPNEELVGTCTTGTFDRAQLGTSSINVLDWFWDSYADDPAGWIGPGTSSGGTGEVVTTDNFAVWNAAPGSGGTKTQLATFVGPLNQWCTSKMTWHASTSTWDLVVKNEAGTTVYSALSQSGMTGHKYLNTHVSTGAATTPNFKIDFVGVNCTGFNNAHCGTKVARYTVTANTGLPYTVTPLGPNNATHHGAFAISPSGTVSFMASLASDNDQNFYVQPKARYLAWTGSSFSTISIANFTTVVHLTGNTAWTTITDQLTAPTGATHWALDFTVGSNVAMAAPTIGTILYLDCVYVVEDGRDLSSEPYLDGDQANTSRGDAVWEGVAENSTSIWFVEPTDDDTNNPPDPGGGGGGGGTDTPPDPVVDTPPDDPGIPEVITPAAIDYATDVVTRRHPARTFCLDADIQLGSHLFNTIDPFGTLWVVNDIDGWWNLPDPDIPDITRGIDDGSYETRGRYSARVFTVSGSFWPDTPSNVRSSRDRLMRAMNLCHFGAWFATHEADATRASKVWLSGRPSLATVEDNGRTDFTIGLKAPDPIKYGLKDRVLPGWNQVALKSSTSTADFGRVYDRVYDWGYPDVPGGGVLADTATVTNAGNVRVMPTITAYGPTLGPIDIHNNTTGQTIRVNTALGSDEVLVIDCLNRTVTLNGVPNKRLYLDTVTDWIYLDPGANRFTYTEETGSSSSFITVQWRSGWIG